MTQGSHVLEGSFMFLRSINFLIGILILLFILTTLGFSETAFANTCEVFFDSPEYSRENEEYSQSGSSEFIHSTSGHYIEGQRRDSFESQDEFSHSPNTEFDYNDSF